MLTLLLLGLAEQLACKWSIHDPHPAALPTLMLYGSCFQPDSEVATAVMKADGIGPESLAAACQSRRQLWLDQAVKAVRAAGSSDMLQEKRKLESQFRTIDRHCGPAG